MEQEAFAIIFKVFSLKQIKTFFLEVESPTLSSFPMYPFSTP